MIFILRTIVQWRKFILTAGVLCALLAAGVSLLLPKWYLASTSVFPPDAGKSMSGIAEILQQSLQIPILAPSAVGARPNTIYIDIALSRTIGERIVQEFGFKQEYGTELMADAVSVLHSHTSFSLLENGLLKISFEDRDPQRAAAVANRYVDLLDEFNRQLNTGRAAKTREFVGQQLKIHEQELAKAEDDLRSFQQTHETLHLDEQVASAIDLVAGLTAQAVGLETDLDILEQYASKASEEYVRKKQEYDETLAQLEKFKEHALRGESDPVRSYFPAFDKLPEVTLEYARKVRRVKTEEAVYSLLVSEFEKARIEEARDTPTIQVLDAAKVPELRSRPRRTIVAVLGLVVGLGWSSLFALFYTVSRQEGGARNFLSVFHPIAADFRRVFPFRKRS